MKVGSSVAIGVAVWAILGFMAMQPPYTRDESQTMHSLRSRLELLERDPAQLSAVHRIQYAEHLPNRAELEARLAALEQRPVPPGRRISFLLFTLLILGVGAFVGWRWQAFDDPSGATDEA